MRGARRSLDGVPVLLTGAFSGIGEVTAAALVMTPGDEPVTWA